MAFTSSYTPGLIQQSEYYYGTPEMTPGLSGSFSGSFQGDGTNLNLAGNTTVPSTDPFPFIGDAKITGSLIVSQSYTAGDTDSTALRLIGSGSVSQSGIFEVEGSAGPLFSVADGLDGVLMEVNNISGLPLLQVSSSNEVFVNRGNLTSGVTTATASFAYFTGSFAGDGGGLTNLNVTTAQTASYVETAQTASYVTLSQTASYVTTAQTASYVTLAQTASFALTSSLVIQQDSVDKVVNTRNINFIGNAVALTTGAPNPGASVIVAINTGSAAEAFPFTGDAQITGSLIVSGASANNLLDVGSGTSGKSRLIVTDNNAYYNTYINGELYLGANGVTPQIHFGSDNIIYSMRRNGSQGLTIGNTEFNNGQDVSIYRSLEVGRNTGTIGSNKLTVTGSAAISGSGGLSVESSGSTVFEVIGSEGTLFSIDDDLDGVIFTANDRSGLPVLEASASGEVYIGKSPQSLYTTAVISSNNANVTQSIYGLDTSSYGGAFFEYTAHSGSNARAGNIMSVWNGSSLNFTETTTTDIGSTSDLVMKVHISESQAQLAAFSTNAGYNIKTIIKSI